MRYKGQFYPTYFLDPENNEWNLLDDTMKKRMSEKFYLSPSKPDAVSLYQRNRDLTEEDDSFGDEEGGEIEEVGGLWASQMPGVPSIEEIESSVDLGRVKIYIPGSGHVTAKVCFLFLHQNTYRLMNTECCSILGQKRDRAKSNKRVCSSGGDRASN